MATRDPARPAGLAGVIGVALETLFRWIAGTGLAMAVESDGP